MSLIRNPRSSNLAARPQLLPIVSILLDAHRSCRRYISLKDAATEFRRLRDAQHRSERSCCLQLLHVIFRGSARALLPNDHWYMVCLEE